MPDEIAAAMSRLAVSGTEHGLLDARTQGAELPVYTIAAGKAGRSQ